jgi:beta-mannosidase
MYSEICLNGAWDLCDGLLAWTPVEAQRLTAATEGWIPTPVPGDIHQGLVAAGRIPEPLLGLNTTKCAWTESRSWWYRTAFTAAPAWLTAEVVELEMNGLDAAAEIFLNGAHLGSHRNAFRPFVTDVRPLLVAGRNVLLVRLSAGVEKVTELEMDEPDGVRAGTEAGNGRPERGEPRRTLVRKPQYSWGWDWSPRCATTAIGGNVTLRVMSGACIRNVALHPVSHTAAAAVVRAVVTVERFHYYQTSDGKVNLTLTDAAGQTVCAEKAALLRSGLNFLELLITVPTPRLWWPNGVGEQHLYQVAATLELHSGQTQALAPFRWGLRFLELDTDAVFAVKVNGHRVFCKGANWIPADTLYARTSAATYETLVRQACEANFTMLRVWGGGLYEPDAFYDACDRHGILLWHDFMFACAPYPDHREDFRREVELEADYQVRRLQRHACLALWSGSNENNWGFRDWWRERTHGGAVAYNYILPEAVRRHSPEIPYWNGSPYGGDAPNCEEVGDRHHWHDCMMNPDMQKRITPEEFDRCNALFVSEFGYIGAPCRETIETYLDGAPPERQGDVWHHHTNTFEKGTVAAGVRKHYVDPEGLSLDDYILSSGLVQGLMYGYSLESMRVRPNCHGGLFWMYEDCWGEVGWTIVDYSRRRKISWYFVRRTFAPLRLILRAAGDGAVRVVLANDTRQDESLTLEYGYVRLDGNGTDLARATVRAPAVTRTALCEFRRGEHDPRAGLWIARVPGRSDILPAIFRAVDYRELRTSDPGLSSSVRRVHGGVVLTVSAKAYAHALQITGLPSAAEPEDNYFDLLPGECRDIRIADPPDGQLDPNAIRVAALHLAGPDRHP